MNKFRKQEKLFQLFQDLILSVFRNKYYSVFLTGNKDMNLKNFSLLKSADLNYNLCPAHDLVASQLVVEGDDDELALNLNGKKNLKKVITI